MRVRVFHAVGTLGGYVEGSGEKSLSFWAEIFFLLSKNGIPSSFVKLFGLASGTSMRGMVALILVKNDFNYFSFYSIDR